MRLLIEAMHRAIEEAKLQAVALKPNDGRDPAYTFGYVQGKYTGLNEALKIIRDFLDNEREREKL
jgi:hypothetical protein